MHKVGVTGGIGAGKSLICQMFEVLGRPVYYADKRAKELIVSDPKLKSEIINLLGVEAYLADGNYNRAYVGSKVFENKDLLKKLNALVHPAVHDDSAKWFSEQSGPYALYEAALILEANRTKTFDSLICVTAPTELRIQRVMKRNGISTEDVLERIKSQSSDNEKRKHCHFEVINDEQHFLIPQVLFIDKTIRAFR